MKFVNPEFLSLLLVLVPLSWHYLRARARPAVSFSDFPALTQLRPSASLRWRRALPLLRVLALGLCIVALARPQWGVEVERVYREGISISMVVDISSSMGALDLELDDRAINRLDVVKRTFRAFVLGANERARRGAGAAGRANAATDASSGPDEADEADDAGDARDRFKGRAGDLISMVTFARYADELSPLTADHEALLGLLERVNLATVPEEDGTAIGDGIAAGIDSLSGSEGTSRVMIVLTDGSNNAGAVTPTTAAAAAKALGVRVYTIGAGTRGVALMPARRRDGGVEMRPAPVYIDEFTLEKVAEVTGGKYFRATDGAALTQIYGEIDRLEKARQVHERRQKFAEAAPVLLLAALLALSVELVLSFTVLRVAPSLEAR